VECGALRLEDGSARFTVWAPGRESVELLSGEPGPDGARTALRRRERGYWTATLAEVPAGWRYRYLLDGETLRPDPASHQQPEGVHGPSAVIDHRSFRWEDGAWPGLPLERMVLYELHVGTFCPEGTFAAIIPRLSELAALGVTTVELMPVCPFPGDRNWGYDGVYPYAVQESYGGPEGLKELVNACHATGVAVALDMVYNHLGPEGNYLRDYGPYFTDRYRTPWGEALNFDGPWSDEVREYFVGSALHWFSRYHVDALRLDAIHAIYDFSAVPFLEDLARRTQELSRHLGRPLTLMAESDLNDSRVVRSPQAGGLGLHAQWSDDLHHALHAALTGEREGYYLDFGPREEIRKAYRDRFVYDGRYSAHRRRRHGNCAADLPPERFVVFSQNHDQVGNRLLGERSSALLPFEALKLLAASTLLSPYIPLLFMGEEYGEPAPFQYFVSHTEPQLVEAVRRGRRREFEAFGWEAEPPDPQDPATRAASVLHWELRSQGRHRLLLELYRELLTLRGEHPALATAAAGAVPSAALGSGAPTHRPPVQWARPEEAGVLVLHRTPCATTSAGGHPSADAVPSAAAAPPPMQAHTRDGCAALVLLNFSDTAQAVELPVPPGTWRLLLDSGSERWGGPGSTLPAALAPEGDRALGFALPAYGFAVYGTPPGGTEARPPKGQP
jgi:maltooligosyltrehalose trehalohydrolase